MLCRAPLPDFLFMSNRIGQVSDELENLKAYIGRIEKQPAFHKAITMT